MGIANHCKLQLTSLLIIHRSLTSHPRLLEGKRAESRQLDKIPGKPSFQYRVFTVDRCDIYNTPWILKLIRKRHDPAQTKSPDLEDGLLNSRGDCRSVVSNCRVKPNSMYGNSVPLIDLLGRVISSVRNLKSNATALTVPCLSSNKTNLVVSIQVCVLGTISAQVHEATYMYERGQPN
ncbi:hypothetical protein FCULG_00009654 [Fusarium culmorum]|uniref:Uncharacterized protein n=1 Tax=Fusarium culmorum TaxID=5516 RepID=A0A2T4GHB6_FUSCU|nr:hypothetical protein FCULG_00009654 [Fusarium culmorum]